MKRWISSAAVVGGCSSVPFSPRRHEGVSKPPMAKKMTHVEAVHGDKLVMSTSGCGTGETRK